MRACVRTSLLSMAVMCSLSHIGFAQENQFTAVNRVQVLVREITQADYAGDREALGRLAVSLDRIEVEGVLRSRVHYWKGFSYWRRALNGFNDSAGPEELQQDLSAAVTAFEYSAGQDPAFADAKIGAASCLFSLSNLLRSEPDRSRQLLARAKQLLNEAIAQDPDNPRLLWLQGANFWWSPPQFGGDRAKAIETYKKGLEYARKQPKQQEQLEPTWGEPELLMNLAYSFMHSSPPNLAAAELYANEALQQVPNWHYVRDVLIPEIRYRLSKEEMCSITRPASRAH